MAFRREKIRLVVWLAFCLIITILTLQKTEVQAQARPSLEYQIKASLVYNFVQFVEWPPAVNQDASTLMDICIAGEDRFGIAMDSLKGELVRGMRLEVRHIANVLPSSLDSCMVIFFSDSLNDRLTDLLRALRGKSILTIGESDRFLEAGGILRLTTYDDKVAFDVNRTAALEARLTISSKLLRLAHYVQG